MQPDQSLTMSLKKASIKTVLSDGFMLAMQVPESAPVLGLSSWHPSTQAVEPTAPRHSINIVATTTTLSPGHPHTGASGSATTAPTTQGQGSSSPSTPTLDPSSPVRGQLAANAALGNSHLDLQSQTDVAVALTQPEAFLEAALSPSPVSALTAPVPLVSQTGGAQDVPAGEASAIFPPPSSPGLAAPAGSSVNESSQPLVGLFSPPAGCHVAVMSGQMRKMRQYCLA